MSGDRYIAGHLGDGVIGRLSGEEAHVVSGPERGEFANETYFLTGASALKHLRVTKGPLGDVTGFILMSDGAAESLYDKRKQTLAEAAGQMIQWLDDHPVKTVSTALASNMEELFKAKTTDDCGVVVMRAVDKRAADLQEAPLEFAAEYLGCGLRSVKNRLRFLTLLEQKDGAQATTKELARRLRLSSRTVRAYITDMLGRGLIRREGDRLLIA